jgi:hypothetical protein
MVHGGLQPAGAAELFQDESRSKSASCQECSFLVNVILAGIFKAGYVAL